MTTCLPNKRSIVDETEETIGTPNGIINHTSIKTVEEGVDPDEASKDV